jgi:hypothetical protein
MRVTGQTVKRTVSREEVATFVPFPLADDPAYTGASSPR